MMTHVKRFPKLKNIFKLFKDVKDNRISHTEISVYEDAILDDDTPVADDTLIKVNIAIDVICTYKEFKDILEKANKYEDK